MLDTLVNTTLPGLIRDLSFVAYLLVFAGGVLTSLGPCNISMVPVLMGYVAGQKELTRGRSFRLSLFFTLGSSLTFAALGVVAFVAGGVFGKHRAPLMWTAAAVCFAIGLNLVGAVRVNFDLLTRLQPLRTTRTGSLGALLLGLVMGLTGSQCATPILTAIISIVMVKHDLVAGALLLFVYGLRRGVPVVLVGTYTGVLRALPAMARWTDWAQKVAGVVILAVGLYLLWISFG